MKKLKARLTAYRQKLSDRRQITNAGNVPHSPYHWLILPKGGEPIPQTGTNSQIITIGWSK